MLRHHPTLGSNAFSRIDHRMRLPEQFVALRSGPRLEPATIDATITTTVLLKPPDEQTD